MIFKCGGTVKKSRNLQSVFRCLCVFRNQGRRVATSALGSEDLSGAGVLLPCAWHLRVEVHIGEDILGSGGVLCVYGGVTSLQQVKIITKNYHVFNLREKQYSSMGSFQCVRLKRKTIQLDGQLSVF